VDVWQGWSDGDSPWGLTLFLVPFVLIGIGMIIHLGYRIVALFSPLYEVEFGDETLEAGGRMSLSWRRCGGGGTPQSFSLWLIGREEATYRRGTDTTTATELFHESSLFETDVRQMMPAGKCTLELPSDAVPTFEGENNKQQWFVVLTAEVPWRPDVRDEFELMVLPKKGGGL
jgi:hypothetical protein